jgi:Flp pilus assembly protein TadD
MPGLRVGICFGAISVFALYLLTGAPATLQEADILWHHRNLGKAFYENPTTQKEAVEEFRKALGMDPKSTRERLNFALALIKAGETKQGVAELEKVQQQDPALPHTWFNLGMIAKKDGDAPRAIQQFETMVQLVPNDAISHYNLGTMYKQTGRLDDARKEFETAARLGPLMAAPRLQLFNSYRAAGRAEEGKREIEEFQRLKKLQEGAPIAENMEANDYSEIYDPIDVPAGAATPLKFSARKIASGVSGMVAADVDGDGKADLITWSAVGVRVLKNGTEPLPKTGLENLRDVVSIAASDYDNDGLQDLCVLTQTGAKLYRNTKGAFVDSGAALPKGSFTRAIWIDIDHDNDLDLILLGSTNALARNNGEAGFSDETAAFPFVKGNAIDAIRTAIRPETPARDLLVSYADREGVLYRDLLGGKFEAQPVAALPAGTTGLRAEDFNHDAFFDLTAPGLHLQNNQGQLQKTAGDQDPQGVVFDSGYAQVNAAGELLLHEPVKSQHHTMTVAIGGIKNLKSGVGAVVEVRAGALYQRKIYEGLPLWFDMQTYSEADTVRITWPNGLIQNEPRQKTNQSHVIAEAQRLSGSCPMIFTWNGSGFEFITDVLGVAPLGANSGDGHYFPVDHNEYIQIPGESLQPKDGVYSVRITEELHEVSYLDQVQLIAVDHPADVEVFTNDKFKSPPFPEFQLFGTHQRIYPSTARDDHGHDILPALLHCDQHYPDQYRRTLDGVAEMHSIDLDFGASTKDNHAVLILNGWVDWADGSTFVAAAQSQKDGLVFPYLQVKDAQGKWKTVVQDMGIPSGKPKTIAVDLTGKFLSSSRAVRIVTNLCVYWDEIFLSGSSAPPLVHLTPLTASAADLHYRGFSVPRIDRERKQPEQFQYDSKMPLSNWNPTPGNYTRYGCVRELATAVDDRFVIMGSGDELTLQFPASLPAPPQGWRRDFLLLVDGWAKDADANTAFSQSVEPLPFHRMSAYPYQQSEHYPDDAAHQRYRREYLTRPALRLIRPLT